MTEQERLRYLRDVNKLLRAYRNDTGVERCPLCEGCYCQRIYRPVTLCLWPLFEGKSCTDAKYSRVPYLERIPRILRWRKRLYCLKGRTAYFQTGEKVEIGDESTR